MSSIDHGHENESADIPADQIAVDGSVGSDTDTGGPLRSEGTNKEGTDIQHHARSNSVKKPTTFKAVSVTKNFLAKAGAPSTPTAKTNGENVPSNASNNMPAAVRPRLVAKSASASKGAASNKANFGSKDGGVAPDPMQVWNRNRAAPQPSQKHFTDEELKQQYGIHLATRLQADSDGKEAKWADIDDDEDDWAPDAIEWNDGTKITLSQNEAPNLLPEDPKFIAPAMRDRVEEKKEVKDSETPKPTTTVGPNATVLKPRSLVQPKPAGVVLKTPSEKPSLVSKPAIAPTPARSPWAVLPPVEKVSPAAITPEIEPASARSQHAEISVAQPAPAPPAMEIAADSFTRSRADGPNGTVGQLYNAQSGRYEPANAGRRGSVRKDQNFRPPSVLQRGSNAERAPTDSTSLHTRSGSQAESAPWTRRGSSNISADGVGPGRRPSVGRALPNGLHDDSRGSQHSQAIQSPTMSGSGHLGSASDRSPAQQSAKLAGQSPGLQHAQMEDARSANASPSSARDTAVAQRQLMLQKREEAIRRRKEEEEREEAAKKERIRLKLESLDHDQPPAKKESSVPQPTKSIEKRPGEAPAGEDKLTKSEANSTKVDNARDEVKLEGPKSPPKPPLPDASGAPQQYGMIKMHGSAPPNNLIHDGGRLHIDKAKSSVSAQDTRAPAPQAPPVGNRLPSPLVNGVKHADPSPPKTSDESHQKISRETRQQPWSDVPKDQKMLSTWGNNAGARDPSSAQASVWGAPSTSRALGNGTFDRSSQRAHPQPQDQFSAPGLAPIGPPKPSQSIRDPRETLRPGETSLKPSAADIQSLPPFSSPESASVITNQFDPAGRPETHPGLPPYGHNLQSRSGYSNLDHKAPGLEQKRSSLAAWGNFGKTVVHDEALQRQQAAAKMAEDIRSGVRQEPQLPKMHETWKQVKVDENTTERSVINVTRPSNTGANSQFGLDIRDAAFTPSSTTPPVAGGMGRGSRFFPTTGRGGLHPYTQPSPFTPGFRRGSSPPPPDSDFHPAFARDQAIPRVSLPTVGPKPKVRLPPSIASPVQPQEKVKVSLRQVPSISQPGPSAPSWQDKFNGLLGVKKHSPEKTFAETAPSSLASAFSATKEPLLSPLIQVPAAVSLPPKAEGPNGPIIFMADSKDAMDEESLFIPEAGSLPVAKLPLSTAHDAFKARRAWRKGPPKQVRSSKEINAVSKEVFAEMVTMGNGGPMVFIRLTGMSIPKSKTMARMAEQVKADVISANQQRPRNISGGLKPTKPGPKPRPASGNFNPTQRNGTYPRGGQHNNLRQPQITPSLNSNPWATDYVR